MSEPGVVIVTGASSGIGRATAVTLAEAGFRVALAARRVEALEETARLAKARAGRGAELAVMPVDLADAEATRALVDRVAGRWGRLDALANVAGDAPRLAIEQITPEIWRRCIDANLSYVIHLTSAAWPVFRRQKSGVIVNISSMASIDPFPGFSIYAAAKIGLNMFTRVTAREGGAAGIKAVALALGAVETPMLRAIFDEKTIPRSKTLKPETVAALIRDCITGAREFKSGETITLPSS